MNDQATRAAQVLTSRFLADYPEDAAKRLEHAPLSEIVEVFNRVWPAEAAAVTLERMSPDIAGRVIEELESTRVPPILECMDPAIASSLISRLDAEVRDRVLNLINKTLADELSALMTYPPETAGSLMDPRVITFRPEATVEEALKKLRRSRNTRIYDVF